MHVVQFPIILVFEDLRCRLAPIDVNIILFDFNETTKSRNKNIDGF